MNMNIIIIDQHGRQEIKQDFKEFVVPNRTVINFLGETKIVTGIMLNPPDLDDAILIEISAIITV